MSTDTLKRKYLLRLRKTYQKIFVAVSLLGVEFPPLPLTCTRDEINGRRRPRVLQFYLSKLGIRRKRMRWLCRQHPHYPQSTTAVTGKGALT
ncbi:hypothetical protein CDAR_281091 [Caerostris darwini]|uniref:Ribosomal protein S14 n=1 Tax=Caerostris darwini TaxID=1538125 RepID=A0AAV4ND36_9ARAC|nr:hypothetical protein CDAR_281091 [Caerostris darwini]